jgi:hypothetical protein
MARATKKTVECPFKKPIFIRRYIGVATGRAYDGNLVGWKNSLTEGVLAIVLAKGVARSEAILVRKQSESWRRTGANLSLFFQTRSS